MNLIVDGLHISGLDQGKGPAVLLLHGWGNDHRGLLAIANNLKGYRVIAPDLPGFGASQPPKEAWGVEDYAQFCLKLLDKLGVDTVELLVGHSFGGRISLVLAGEEMVPIKKMVLLSSHGLPEAATLRGKAVKVLASIGKAAPKSLRQSVGRRMGSSDFTAAQGIMKDIFKRVIAQDATPQAKTVTCPTLLIYGEQDDVTPIEMGQRLSGLITGSKLELVAGAGHHPHQDNPSRVNELIRKFIG